MPEILDSLRCFLDDFPDFDQVQADSEHHAIREIRIAESSVAGGLEIHDRDAE